MNQFALLFATVFGLTAIVFGAFGAHLLKKKLNTDQLNSFETGVKYQMYHAIVLLILGLQLPFQNALQSYSLYSFVIGVFLFSFSIYGLVLSDAFGKKLKFLGPITPLGGLFLILGWAFLFISFLN